MLESEDMNVVPFFPDLAVQRSLLEFSFHDVSKVLSLEDFWTAGLTVHHLDPSESVQRMWHSCFSKCF